MTSKSPLLDATSLLLPGIVALLVLAPAVDGWFRADDLLFNPFLDSRVDHVAVAWDRVGSEFVDTSWRAGVMQYRPMIAVAYATLLTLGGGAPTAFFVANLLLHFVSSTLCAWLCFRLSKGRRIAALCGGALFALHPANGEAVGWIAAITADLETCLRLSCFACFVSYLSSGKRLAYLGAFVFCGLGLATLETSIVTPLSLVMLDLAMRPGRFAALIKRQLPFASLGLVYVVARVAVIARGSNGAVTETLARYPETLPGKLLALLAPFPEPLARHVGFWLSVALGITVLMAACNTRARLVSLAVGGAWILAHFVPSGAFEVAADLEHIRIVHPVAASLAMLLAVVLWRDAAPSRILAGTGLILTACIVSFVPVTRTLLLREAEAAHFLRRVQTQLVDAARDATPARPLVCTSHPKDAPNGLGVVWHGGAHVLAQLPYAQRDHPVVMLNYLIEDRNPPSALRNDAAPWRALREQGSEIVTWIEGRFVTEPAALGSGDLGVTRKGNTARFDFSEPQAPSRFEAVRVRTRSSVKGGTLLWNAPVAADPRLCSVAFSNGRAAGDERIFEIDLSHDIRLLALQKLGVTGFTVEGVGSGDVLALEVLARVRHLDVDLIQGDELRFGPELALGRPVGVGVSLVLIGPGFGTSVLLATGGPIRLPRQLLDWFAPDLQVSRARRVYYYFAAPGARSMLGWFRAR